MQMQPSLERTLRHREILRTVAIGRLDRGEMQL